MSPETPPFSPPRMSLATQIGSVSLGGEAPIRIQSMTDTDTADVERSYAQIIQLAQAGSEMVRLTVDRPDSARAIPILYKKLERAKLDIPLIGDFHYNGHQLLQAYPDCAQALAKYRINPGNVGFRDKWDVQFTQMIEIALKWHKPIRIGVNGGSLDQALLGRLMDENAAAPQPVSAQAVMREAIIQSALLSAQRAEEIGLPASRIILSTKVSDVQELICIYTQLAKRCRYILHLGLTEAGMGTKGTVSSAAALAILLSRGIGDTIRVSLTPRPGEPRTQEVKIAQSLLQSLGFRFFAPRVTACPGCGRTTSSFFRKLAHDIETHIQTAMPLWRKTYPGVENLKIAVMGCIVNGPGESKQADIGISLPGTGESPAAPVYIDGCHATTLKSPDIDQKFMALIEQVIRTKYRGVAERSDAG